MLSSSTMLSWRFIEDGFQQKLVDNLPTFLDFSELSPSTQIPFFFFGFLSFLFWKSKTNSYACPCSRTYFLGSYGAGLLSLQ